MLKVADRYRVPGVVVGAGEHPLSKPEASSREIKVASLDRLISEDEEFVDESVNADVAPFLDRPGKIRELGNQFIGEGLRGDTRIESRLRTWHGATRAVSRAGRRPASAALVRTSPEPDNAWMCAASGRRKTLLVAQPGAGQAKRRAAPYRDQQPPVAEDL